ncbi:MAG: hypothetical protein LUG57_06055 [Oscillospiraceae bacterium]|nr:hypothetical protein [Oscillospiraceae bacterium]
MGISPADKSSRLICGEYAVENAVQRVLAYEAVNTEDAKIQMFLPDRLDLTKTLVELWAGGANLRVEHLLCFPTTGSDCTQKIGQLNQILPICLVSHGRYSPYYFYDRPSIVNPLNYYIITPHYLIQLSPDCLTAQIQCSDYLIQHFSEYFQRLLTSCDLLVSYKAEVYDALPDPGETDNKNGLRFLTYQPCLGRYFTPEIIARHFSSAEGPHQTLWEQTEKRSAFLRSVSENYYTVFTEKGLRDFAETGVILALPSCIPPFEVEERIYFLSQLRDEIASGQISGLIANPSNLRLPNYLSLYIGSDTELHFDTTAAFMYGPCCCHVHVAEKSICQAFQTFLHSLPGSHLVYPQEETLRILKESITNLENRPREAHTAEGACGVVG